MPLRFAIVRNFTAAPLSKKLGLVGGAIGVCLLTMLVGNLFSPQDKAVTRGMLGHDFLAFYTAGSFVRDGRSRELYRLESIRNFQHEVSKQHGLETGPSFGPWWNPPFYALAFEPLAKLPYPAALSAWRTINLLSLATAVATLMAMVIQAEPTRWRATLLVPLLVVITMPFIQALSHGQNTMTSLLLLTATCALWRSHRGVLAGLVGGLLFFKPQLGAVLAGVMLLDLGIPAFIGPRHDRCRPARRQLHRPARHPR